MKSLQEIEKLIDNILATDWQRRQGRKVPETDSIALGNDAVELDATVLYADLADSTGLVQGYKDWFAAEVYKSYLLGACEIIRNNEGNITAFDGDRVMSVFIGDSKNSNAAKAALQINYLVTKVINPKMKSRYPNSSYVLKQAVGIDTSKLFVARTGIRGSNDLVWVGRAANYAAKLCDVRNQEYASFITESVFSKLSKSSKYGGENNRLMWDKFMWSDMGIPAYRSSWHWNAKLKFRHREIAASLRSSQ